MGCPEKPSPAVRPRRPQVDGHVAESVLTFALGLSQTRLAAVGWEGAQVGR